jgi:DNA-binding beta-propeller fold protein YncE
MPVPATIDEAIAVSPSGRTAYVIDPNGIVPVDLVTGTAGTYIAKGSGWQSIALDASTQTLYLAAGGGRNSIVPVNVKTGVTGTPIPVPGTPVGVSVSPDGRTAYVITQGGASFIPVNLVTRTVGAPISVPMGVDDLAITRNGAMAYATGTTNVAIGSQTFSYVTPIDLKGGIVEKPIALRHAPYGIALSRNGRTAYVTGGTYPAGAEGPPVPPDVTSINLVTGRVRGNFSIRGGADDIVNATS